MAHPDLAWRLHSSRPEHVANARVCLALLRIYRAVQLPQNDMDMADVAKPFWPLIRRHPNLLKLALEGYRFGVISSRQSKRISGPDARQELAGWVKTHIVKARALPEDPGLNLVFEAIGESLLCAGQSFAALIEAVERDLIERSQRKRLPMDKNIDMLAGLLGLSTEEKNFFALCAAVNMSTIGTSPFSCARAPTRLVQAMQHAIVAPDEHCVRSMMRRGARLLRSGLLDGEAWIKRNDMEDALRLSRQGMLLLSCKARSLADMAAVVLKKLPAVKDEDLRWPHLEDRTKLLEQLIAQSVRARATGVNVLLYGAPGTGKTQFAASLVERVGSDGYGVADIDTDGDAASRSERLASLLLTQAFAPTGRSVVVLDEAEDIFQADYNNPFARMVGKREEGKSWMNSLLEGNASPVIWISNRIDNMDPAYLRRFTYCLEFPQTPRGVRRAIAHRHLDPLGCSSQLVETVGCDVSVSPGMLASAARFTRLAGLTEASVDAGVKAMLGDMVNSMGLKLRSNVPERSTRFDLRYLNVRGAVTGQAVVGALERLGRGRVLLSGAPGTGKTQLAAEVAQRLGRELVYKTASDLNSMWFGQSERNVAQMFQECDPKGEVLLLDEADTLLGAREESGHRAEVAVTAEFLRQIETFQGVFLCATNFGAGLDAALTRRFEYRLELQPLTISQRLDLFCETALGWNAAEPDRPPVDANVSAQLARLDLLTPGDFANVVRRISALQLELDPAGWVGELQAEQDAKPGARRAVLGFL